jgi:hypothetical protein
VVTQLAYDPPLVYYDSARYLANAHTLALSEYRPLGYALFLRGLSIADGDLAVISLVQHLIGLGMAVVLYVLLLRLGLRRWVAALAAAPVLLDAYQLNIEEYVLSETLFEALLVGACALILWRRRPSPALAAGAGLLLAGVAITRANGMVAILPALLVVALARRPAAVIALLAAFAAPVAAYAIAYHAAHGSYAITGSGGQFLYARVAGITDCSRFSVPRYQRTLCPREPLGHRLQVDIYMWSNRRSPYYHVRVPPGTSRQRVAFDFARTVILHQPLDYGRIVLHDFLRGFAPTRTRHAGELPISRWQFPVQYPIFSRRTAKALRTHGEMPPRTRPALARFLRGYQRFGYVSNLLLGLGLVAALLAAAGVGRARHSGLRSAALLFALMALAVLVPVVAVNQFTWRYQIPQLVLLPPAAAIGLTALLRRRVPPTRRDAPDEPER